MLMPAVMKPSAMEVHLKTLIAAATLLMISTASFAQTTANTPSQAAAPVAAAGDWSASKMSGVNVYNEANDKIGEISDVIVNSQGQVRGVVVEVGGFLGMGTHYVLIAMNSLKFANEAGKTTAGGTSKTKREWFPDRAVLNLTKDQLKALPEFKY
jgi:sporulation protein YlmC with PRC-barrel domain